MSNRSVSLGSCSQEFLSFPSCETILMLLMLQGRRRRIDRNDQSRSPSERRRDQW